MGDTNDESDTNDGKIITKGILYSIVFQVDNINHMRFQIDCISII